MRNRIGRPLEDSPGPRQCGTLAQMVCPPEHLTWEGRPLSILASKPRVTHTSASWRGSSESEQRLAVGLEEENEILHSPIRKRRSNGHVDST